MSDSQEFRNHGLWQKLAEVEEASLNIKAKGVIDREVVGKVTNLAKYLNSFRTGSFLLPSTWAVTADELLKQLEIVLNELQNWRSGGISPNSKQVLDAAIDSSLTQSLKWPLQTKTKAENVLNLAQEMVAQIRRNQLEFEAFENSGRIRIEQLEAELATARHKFETDLQESQSVRAALEGLQEDVTARAKAEIEKNSIALNQHYEEQLNAVLESATTRLSQLEDMVESGKSLEAIKAGEVLSDGYNGYSKSQKLSQYVWQGIGLVIAGLGFYFLREVFTVSSNLPTEFQVFLKASITVSFGLLVAYAFREAGKLGKSSEVAKYRHLDSVALSTYVKGLQKPEDGFSIQRELGIRLAKEQNWEQNVDYKTSKYTTRRILKIAEALAKSVSR